MVRVGDLVIVDFSSNEEIHNCTFYVEDYGITESYLKVVLVQDTERKSVTEGIKRVLHKRFLNVVPTDYRHVIDLALATNDREWFDELVGREKVAEQ